MARFRQWNNITGWLSFLIAAVVYLLTIEPTVSFWDCGEFIASSYKLEVGHPPGAPLFLMMAKVCSLIAPQKEKVALMINAMSAIISAFTILFLFWTITRLARKIVAPDGIFDNGKIITILGAGFVGALAYTFSDTFWFSAVESEVYSTSSLFTAVVFWAILKWEESVNEPFANRWLVLIAYLMGLSIGVHLLNLLVIPAIVLIFYFKKYSPTKRGVITSIIVSFLILAFVQYIIIAGTVKLASETELLFVNKFNLSFNSGIIFYCILLFVLLIGGIWITGVKRKVIANTVFLIVAMLLFGYGSYATIIIRASANTPLNEGNPANVFDFLSYVNREQYGDRPLLFGQYFSAPVIKYQKGAPTFIKENGKYVIADRKTVAVYDKRFTTFFPRMYSKDSEHISVYKQWTNFIGKPLTVKNGGEQVVAYCPSFGENVLFFLRYQLGYMYFRYFLWNFTGRQNELGGDGGILCGNWITGIKWIDNALYGPQNKLPTYMKQNKARNKYYCLPLLLGLIGMFYQLWRRSRDFLVVLLLFFMTGIAIVIYLNQAPLQPRERDYAYAGSFYAFAVWIGLGVLALTGLFKKWISSTKAALVSVIVCFLAVPAVLASENWDDHDRSGRYVARDVAYNYLNTCAPNAILFTVGDNETFPLWYLQEVEGIRTDVRVVNLTLLDADWYISQMKCRVYNSAPLPVSLAYNQYRPGKLDVVYFTGGTTDYVELKDAISFVGNNPKFKNFSNPVNIPDYLPSRNLVLPVDTGKVISNGTIHPRLSWKIEPRLGLKFSEKKWYIRKNELIVMDILAENNWDRPVYYTSPYYEGTVGLDDYLQLDGFAYRLVPLLSKRTVNSSVGRIESSVLYDNFMNKFRWKNINNPGVFIDNYADFTFSVLHVRDNFARLAEQLFSEGKKDSSLKVIDRCLELMPSGIYPHNNHSLKLAEAAYKVGADKEANRIIEEYANKCFEELTFYNAVPGYLFGFLENERNDTEQILLRLGEISVINGYRQRMEWIKRKLEKVTGKIVEIKIDSLDN
jgi:hypothetical protein